MPEFALLFEPVGGGIQGVFSAQHCFQRPSGSPLWAYTKNLIHVSSPVVRERCLKAMARNVRGARMVVKGLASTDHPLLAHIIPIRRCNLACEYCNEFDDFSKPVPIETMFRRIDKLAELGTSVITISGGEPRPHPELDDVIRRIRKHGMIAGLITNGYLLVAERIQRLNRAALEWLQISIDNVTPDDVSRSEEHTSELQS